MRFLALDDRLQPAHVLHAGHDADGLCLPLQHRPLLDMRFEAGLDRLSGSSGASVVKVRALQFVPHAGFRCGP
jgi:hypothetical protein